MNAKKFFTLVLAISFMVVLVACGTGNNGGNNKTTGKDISFTLVNGTDYELTSLTVSKAGKKEWGNNFINGKLKIGENITIKINLPTEANNRLFDLAAKSSSDLDFLFINLDLSEATEKGGTIYLATTEAGDTFINFSPAE